MPQGTKISFVVWPDGKVDGRSLTLFGERFAREWFIRDAIPQHWFGDIDGLVADRLWHGAKAKGFRSYTIEIGKDGKPTLAE